MTWANFRREEFACNHCGKNEIDPEFIDKLQEMRTALGFPMVITSGYRCPEWNQKVSSTGPNGPHTTGRAADVFVYGFRAHDFLTKALELKIPGIGIKQHGDSRFVHIDLLTSLEGFPRPTIWSYP